MGGIESIMSPSSSYTNDFYSREAKRLGFRARSVFKLRQIQEKHRFVKFGDAVLDLGAAPGSFLQYLSRAVGPKGFVLGVDLAPIKGLRLRNVKTLCLDLTQKDFNSGNLLTYLPHYKKRFDCLTADLAPNTTGIPDVDQARSIELNEQVLKIAQICLKHGGYLLTKVFQGEDFQEFIKKFKMTFRETKIIKPKATRGQSFEVFLLGIKK